jgi:alpha-beta hydrolase superfamily lysophospholipase
LSGLFKKVGPTSPGKTGWDVTQRTCDAANQAALRSDELAHGIVTLRASEQAAEAAKKYVPRASELSMPVLVMSGTADPIATAESVRALKGPSVETATFEGLRHDLFHESRSAEVLASLRAWLDRRLPR